MKFPCPYCRKELNLMELQLEADLHAIIAMIPSFGRQANLVMAYVEIFGISPMKANTKKVLVLLEEMKRLFDAGEFAYQKRRYRISTQGIAEALNVVVHRHFEDRLDGHNYLRKVMITISEREGRDAGRQGERDLHTREQSLQAGIRTEDDVRQPTGRATDGAPPPDMTPAQIEENKRRVRQLQEMLGQADDGKIDEEKISDRKRLLREQAAALGTEE